MRGPPDETRTLTGEANTRPDTARSHTTTSTQPHLHSRIMATVRPRPDFDPEQSCQELREAMKGAGTDEEAIIKVLCSHSNDQRQELQGVYKSMYGRDLMDDIKDEISGEFETVGKALLRTPVEYLAYELRKAMEGSGTDEGALIEILCSRGNDEVTAIKEKYKEMHDRDLEADIESETSDDFRRMLISQVSATRDESEDVDRQQAVDDAQAIWDAGEAELGTDEEAFNMILCRRSFNQLRATFKVYEELAGKDIEDSIRAELSGDLEDGMLAIVKSIKDVSNYYAYRMYKAMKGGGTSDRDLIRITVSRCEIDMQQIKRDFHQVYEDSLANWIRDDTSGDYEKTLLYLIGEDEE